MSLDLGRYGIWVRASEATPEIAREVEVLGYRALWAGGSPGGDLSQIESLLTATDEIPVATGIVNIWRDEAGPIAEAFHRIEQRHPGRFVLGVGIGHPEATSDYGRPHETMVAYLDSLAEAGVPAGQMILAALGPRALTLAAERTLGTHPYLTTPRHTRWARGLVGEGPVLAPELTVVVDPDPDRSKELARSFVGRYLRLVNYRNNLLREGWSTDDLSGGGSDRLVDELVLGGSVENIAAGIEGHLAAGADHVAVQVLDPEKVVGYRALASILVG